MEKIGVIAGNGMFPMLAVEEIIKSGLTPVVIALKDETDEQILKLTKNVHWISIGSLQKMIDLFKVEGVTKAIMAGQVKHVKLFSALKLDLRAIKLMASIANKKTDSILGAVANEFGKDGIELLASHKFLTHLIPEKGLIAGKKLTSEENTDIEFGYKIAKQIAGMDIGQSVVVKDKCVLAVESIEGTDEAIKRGASLAGDGVVVVKVAKPNQDFRFDIPVIGPKTIETMISVKSSVLAIDSGATLIIDKDKTLKYASDNNIKITAF